ncbi:hypothetical protein Poli38472_010614 [Pythium oligandrum]|uniref:Ketoreductase domain-containing protein n=1 Tax=Pythium oligandrum TaxID=41045 RepID=A0A8K1C3E5_PYTOL|nr:hypothetical protein Poli38472_010614 [Pythium oligandrum]|eukprot:TMW55732.1 hypothetical protein Poli38472_010614 [Pythium oligandrum]
MPTFVEAAGATTTLFCGVWLLLQVLRKPLFCLDDRVVVVTGAAHGMGKRLAERLVGHGKRVTLVLLDVDEPALQRTREILEEAATATGSCVLAFNCDVADERAVRECVKRIQDAVAPKVISVLVNNAGIVTGKSFEDLTSSDIRRTLAVNTLGQMWMCKEILPILKASGDGLIVSVSSVMGLITGANLTDYCASKAAVCAFIESLRLELWRDGYRRHIRTLLVCPNAVDTGMFQGIMEGSDWTAWLSRMLLPASSELDAAKRIHSAMIHGEELVISCYSDWRGLVVPWLPAIARLLPPSLFDFIVYLGGGVHGMDTFVGRTLLETKQQQQ